MYTFSKFSKPLMTACALAAAAACAPAFAQSFTANEGSVPGTPQNTVVADRISFNYEGRIVQTLVGSVYDGNDPFTESGFLTKASFANGGSAVPSNLNGIAPNGYGIYGIFNIAGTAAQDGSGIRANFESLSMTLFIDPNQNTTLGFSGNTATAGGVTTDDYAIANYTLASGEARVFAGLANGDFDTLLNLTPTAQGLQFFSGPRPFYAVENFGGNTQTITGASLSSSFVASVSGAGTELFMAPIPEPETYAMMLAGLGAMGFMARRRRKA